MQIIWVIYWFFGILMIWNHLNIWHREHPDKDDYLITGIFIFLTMVTMPIYFVMIITNSLKI